jgi:hypothetical protein
MPELGPSCPPLHRPRELLSAGATAHGLRGAQVRLEAGVRRMDVFLYQPPPAQLVDRARWRLVPSPGGRPVTVDAADPGAAGESRLVLTLGGTPDTARYRLEVVPPAAIRFDPLRRWLPVRLRPECPDLGSCVPGAEPRPLPVPSPVHDYLARDWRSLRRALLEYLAREDPDADTSIADPTVALLELFAHAGDLLHYRLDRVATEAYLETARRRTSVRRHARLVDYALSDGVAATTVVHLSVPPAGAPVQVRAGDVAADLPGSTTAFTLDAGLTAHAALGEIAIYDWGEEACCLAAGSTECVLVRPRPADAAPLGAAWIDAGDLLCFELIDPGDEAMHRRWARRVTSQPWPTGAGGAAAFREPLPGRAAQVVEVVEATPFTDPLASAVVGAGQQLTLVRWRAQDALRRAYPVAIDSTSGLPQTTVVRGNLVPAHHGRLVAGARTLAARDVAGEFDMVGGPSLSLRADGRPHRLDVTVRLPSGAEQRAAPVTTLLDAPPGELAVVVDVEDREPPVLRFRSGAVGTPPPAGSEVAAAYEIGGGRAGNVPANALAVLERDAAPPGLPPDWQPVPVRARNPIPAAGGEDPEPLDDARRDAPEAFAAVPQRAVLPADHAAEAARDPLVQRAAAQRGWAGSWPVITTLVDLELPDPAAPARIQGRLDALRMLGTEAAVVEGRPVGLLLALDVCATPGADPQRVRRDVLDVLRPGTDERPGVFHRLRLELGTSVYISAAVAAVAALPQVDAVELREARRLTDPPGTVSTVIDFAAGEVGVLDDDPARPERGRLDVVVRGGS